MLPHLYFGLAKLVFSFTGRRDRTFVVLELSGALGLFLVAFLVYQPLARLLGVDLSLQPITSHGIVAFVIGTTYVGLAFLTRRAAKDKKAAQKPRIHIIDFSWVAMLGATYAGALELGSIRILTVHVPAGHSPAYYQMYYDELKFLLGQAINLAFVLASGLVACMTIIWAGEIWRQSKPGARAEYFETTVSSIKMILAFFFIEVAGILWLALPLFLKLDKIKTYLR